MKLYLFQNLEDESHQYVTKEEPSQEQLLKLCDFYEVFRFDTTLRYIEAFNYGSREWESVEVITIDALLGT